MNAGVPPSYDMSKLQMEKLDRGVVAVRQSHDAVAVSWRMLSSDKRDEAFDLYRNGRKINRRPLKSETFFVDKYSDTAAATYTVKVRSGAAEGSYTLPADAPVGYIDIPLDTPEGGTTPDGRSFIYSANDASVGDVDGDGRYEIILKWDPSNAHDNAHDGFTGPVLVDCYTLEGKRLWRIDLGRNIRAGAHYTQFMVYDLDGDGKAEVVMKTSDGTRDGHGNVIGDSHVDYRSERGRILAGNEYLTVFDGLTGEALHTTDYVPARGRLADWGDSRANRSDRFLACVAYLDGVHPSVVMCRGYYTRAVLAAWDWDGRELEQRWVFDSNDDGCQAYAGQGNHNLRVGDVDGDGCDEIVYGSCTIDHDGTGLYSTGLGHGDAMHMTQFAPDMDGLQVWCCHENRRDGTTFRDAATGRILAQYPSTLDVGRCMAADIDPTNHGVEMWGVVDKDGAQFVTGGIYDVNGKCINENVPGLSVNMAVWWDGDLLRELLDKNEISKYNWKTGRCDVIMTMDGVESNNWTKANPCLQADVLGDWREEVLMRTPD
ncbi:MAG: rhamnogalacturonan lyase, partial [Muribaculaceae bacterium]|nr:rhamnogalacturonan lyase [Muribaculaceae bacterium]